MIFGEVGRSHQTQHAAVSDTRVEGGGASVGGAVGGDSHWLPQPRCSLFLLFSEVYLFGFFVLLVEWNGRTDWGNEPITIHRTASEKVFQFWGLLNVCDEWMSCWCFYRTKPLSKNVSTRVSSLPGLLLQVRSNTGPADTIRTAAEPTGGPGYL